MGMVSILQYTTVVMGLSSTDVSRACYAIGSRKKLKSTIFIAKIQFELYKLRVTV